MAKDKKVTEEMVAPGGIEAARSFREGAEDVEIPHWEIKYGTTTSSDPVKRVLTIETSLSDESLDARFHEHVKIRFRADREKSIKWGVRAPFIDAAADLRAFAIEQTIDPDRVPKMRLGDTERGVSADTEAAVLVARFQPEEIISLYGSMGSIYDRSALRNAVIDAYDKAMYSEEDGAKAKILDGLNESLNALESVYTECAVHPSALDRYPEFARSVIAGSYDWIKNTELPARKPRVPIAKLDAYGKRGRSGARFELKKAALAQHKLDSALRAAKATAEETVRKGKRAEKAAKDRETVSEGYSRVRSRIEHGVFTPGSKERDHLEKLEEAATDYDRAVDEMESGHDDVISAPLVWCEPKMVYAMRPPMRIARKFRRSDHGSRIMRPMKFETDPEARGFGRRMPATGALVVVDCSGSMGIHEMELREILLDTPDSTVVGYSGTGYDGRPNIAILADRMRVVDDHEIPNWDGSNACDLEALYWALDNRRGRPIVWICDGVVTGIHKGRSAYGETYGYALERACKALYAVNSDVMCRVPRVKDTLKLLKEWSTGRIYLPGDEWPGVRLPDRPVGSFS